MHRAASAQVLMWSGFVIVHAWLTWLALTSYGWPLGDVESVYAFWVNQALDHGQLVGIDTAWVYPLLALPVIFLPALAGAAWYPFSWLLMVCGFNLLAVGVLSGWGKTRERIPIVWWWFAFLLLLGPIAVARIDAVAVAIAIVAVALLATRPAVAGALLAVGAWIKIWPAGILLAAVIALRKRAVLGVAAIALTLAVLAAGVLAGGSLSLFSFITEQTGRGLQIEAVIATPWMWAAAFGVKGIAVYYDRDILTFQVSGPGTELAASMATPLMALLVLAIALIAILGVRFQADQTEILSQAALAITTALIVANKVGSPQFTSWLAAPIVLALVLLGRSSWHNWRVPVVLALVAAALTQLVYPVLYDRLLGAEPLMVLALTMRNATTVALLIWAVAALISTVKTAHHDLRMRTVFPLQSPASATRP